MDAGRHGASRPDPGWTLLGGLAAGLILCLGELVLNVWILGRAWEAILARMGMALDLPGLLLAGVGCVVVGVVGVWLHAGLSGTYGPGPVTALRASVALWAVLYAFPVVGLLALGGVGAGFALGFALWGLAELTVAVGAGSWIQHEHGLGASAVGAPRPGHG